MPERVNRVDFEFSKDSTDEQRHQTWHDLNQYGTLVGGAGVENSNLKIQPNGLYAIVLSDDHDAEQIAENVKKSPGIEPSSVKVSR